MTAQDNWPVQESQINKYPKIGLGKLCKKSIILGYTGTTRPDLFYWLLPTKGGIIVGTNKKCAPILGYKLPSDKLTELVVRKAKPSSKPKKLTDDHDLILITYCIS